jgi:2-amino-4-hydroxy-6-hydroxymethyldihydropteridine diphosphokinase
MPMEVGLSLGSNLGDRQAALREAVRRLLALPGVRLLAAAPLYKTDPVGVRPELAHLKYLNTVVIVEAPPDLDVLSLAIHGIEDAMGRRRSADRNAPRIIDIDILYAGDHTRADGILDLPHPRWAQRRFVLQPLADVRPGLVLPGATETVAALLVALPPGESVVQVTDAWL